MSPDSFHRYLTTISYTGNHDYHELTWWPQIEGLIYHMQHSAQCETMCYFQ